MIREITSTELEQMLNNPDYIIIDVREEYEVIHGMLPGAIHIPLQKIPDAVHSLDKSEATYILVCRAGIRSWDAARFMNERGFSVINFADGMMSWNGEIVV
ncbi:rhodanese-like domain-containing protein [Sediminibacillus massiliensis]|uniref:rhodanese-like domain-containing protein n=1 Tax=Sediminibacillus massiliensis TaxID=1926277 RepID=UPI0009886531|nr:rhodanese-like domain-containing protein [Sediminibacillus massiliensis]